MKENNIFKRLWLWFRKILGYDTCDLKPLEKFENEEAYLLYLASDPNAGPRTKKAAVDALRKRYPDGLYSLWKKKCEEKYTIKYRHRKAADITDTLFTVDICYKVYNESNKVVLSRKNDFITVSFDNFTPQKGDKINPLYGLTYKDLSQEVKKQMLENRVKKYIEIKIKEKNAKKWSGWNEAVITVDREEW